MGDARPWSPVEIEERMNDVIEKLEESVATEKALGEEAVHLKREYEVHEAQLLLQTLNHPELKTDVLKRAWVTLYVADEKEAAKIAEHLSDTQRQVTRSLEKEADVLRSLARSHRDMTEQPGYGGR